MTREEWERECYEKESFRKFLKYALIGYVIVFFILFRYHDSEEIVGVLLTTVIFCFVWIYEQKKKIDNLELAEMERRIKEE